MYASSSPRAPSRAERHERAFAFSTCSSTAQCPLLRDPLRAHFDPGTVVETLLSSSLHPPSHPRAGRSNMGFAFDPCWMRLYVSETWVLSYDETALGGAYQKM